MRRLQAESHRPLSDDDYAGLITREQWVFFASWRPHILASQTIGRCGRHNNFLPKGKSEEAKPKEWGLTRMDTDLTDDRQPWGSKANGLTPPTAVPSQFCYTVQRLHGMGNVTSLACGMLLRALDRSESCILAAAAQRRLERTKSGIPTPRLTTPTTDMIAWPRSASMGPHSGNSVRLKHPLFLLPEEAIQRGPCANQITTTLICMSCNVANVLEIELKPNTRRVLLTHILIM